MTGYTPDNHPLRNIKPDDWMLRNLRQTLVNVAPLYAEIDLAATPAIQTILNQKAKMK